MIEEKNLEDILAQVLLEVKEEQGRINLAEIERRTGISRERLRRWQKNGYCIVINGKAGRPSGSSKLSGYTDQLDALLRKGISNSEVCYDRLRENGYTGGRTIVKDYIARHRDLIPAKRKLIVEPQGNRGRRYYTEPGDCFQMDWGFINATDTEGTSWRCACFAMVCHHCGFRYVEFFPNAVQENLFIGMIHAFMLMGIPNRVLTDNMKSVVIRRDASGTPVFNKDYDEFQHTIGFRTDLCKVAHPFTNGKVERLVRYVKDNFIAGRCFLNVSELNRKALEWCIAKNNEPIRGYDHIPLEEHRKADMIKPLRKSETLIPYLAPLRRISFDGFVNYEGRQFGVPYKYSGRNVRVMRDGSHLLIIDPDTLAEIQCYDIDWSKRAKTCPDQWMEYAGQPEELPTAPVSVSLSIANTPPSRRFERFKFPARKEADR